MPNLRYSTSYTPTLPITVGRDSHIADQHVRKTYWESFRTLRHSNRVWLKQLPPGLTPPPILAYNAASVPIIQLTLSSGPIPEQGIFGGKV